MCAVDARSPHWVGLVTRASTSGHLSSTHHTRTYPLPTHLHTPCTCALTRARHVFIRATHALTYAHARPAGRPPRPLCACVRAHVCAFVHVGGRCAGDTCGRVRLCAHACGRAGAHACMRACVRACGRAGGRHTHAVAHVSCTDTRQHVSLARPHACPHARMHTSLRMQARSVMRTHEWHARVTLTDRTHGMGLSSAFLCGAVIVVGVSG